MRKCIIAIIALFILQMYGYSQNQYAIIKLNSSINPVTADFLTKSIKDAQDRNLEFIVVQIDTPGGFVKSMEDIIKAIMNSKIPVVVYGYPKGAQVASAGGYIMLSAHIAVMAPGSRIGAMHPVSPQLDFNKKDKKGNPAGISEKKTLNDLVALARSIAQKRNRNINWIMKAIKKAHSSTAKEAVREGAIDFMADDMPDLLSKLHNRTVTIDKKTKTIKTKNITSITYEMHWKEKFLNYFAHPQMIMLLFIIAVVGIGIEFKSPGLIFPGVIGAISLILFLMAIKILPINIVGLILLVTAIVLFILELNIPSYGLLTLGGIASFVIGSMLLFDYKDSNLQGGHVPLSTIIIVLLFILAFVFIVVRAVINAHKEKITTGQEGLLGETGTALKDFAGNGKISIHGEIWNAYSDTAVRKGDKVTVIEADGMDLKIKKQE